ncbi:hypothetical protein G7070_01270 [Propioniciclava coleopterorum]|uniref:Uncharacterized protein n=1 Tax=Propioniciclava coleopterorum TaxID=2714937 RepID=A0A6G7Y2Q4_9ACTN|nr:hypothetical protein [Propioniciclava coleopterorum]QIK71164.1 hypothetical protein G7070_01270 [Propioniciclava coleopterorum]
MTGGFTYAVTGGGRGLLVRRGGAGVAEFVFGLPEGAASDEDGLAVTVGEIGVRLAQRELGDVWVSELVLDNGGPDEAALPPLGMVVRVEPGWVGWSWTAETDGFVVVAPEAGDGDALLLRLRQGFLRACVPTPSFVPAGRRADALEPGMAAFFLANPAGALRGHGRHSTRLEFGSIPDVDAARAAMPAWIPDLVARPGDEIRFETPDQALVPGPGVRLVGDDVAGILTGSPGHRELAVHGPRGVTRLRPTFTPALDALAAEVSAGLLRRRPAGLPTAAAAVVAAALSRRAVADPGAALDWLEREDWLAREDQFGPLLATTIAVETHDEALGAAAMDALLGRRFGLGDGLIASWAWLGALRLGIPPLDLSLVLERASTAEERWEAALIRQDPDAHADGVRAVIRKLGAGLPGQPIGLGAAEAGLSVALLRAVPEGADLRTAAVEAADKAAALLAADYADGMHPTHDGLAWLVWSER